MRRLGPAHATSDLVAVRLRYARQLLEGVSRYLVDMWPDLEVIVDVDSYPTGLPLAAVLLEELLGSQSPARCSMDQTARQRATGLGELAREAVVHRDQTAMRRGFAGKG